MQSKFTPRPGEMRTASRGAPRLPCRQHTGLGSLLEKGHSLGVGKDIPWGSQAEEGVDAFPSSWASSGFAAGEEE